MAEFSITMSPTALHIVSEIPVHSAHGLLAPKSEPSARCTDSSRPLTPYDSAIWSPRSRLRRRAATPPAGPALRAPGGVQGPGPAEYYGEWIDLLPSGFNHLRPVLNITERAAYYRLCSALHKRYYGWYSNVSRGKRRRQVEAVTDTGPCDGEQARSTQSDRDHSPDARALRRSWAQLIKRIYEVDPLVCPSCGSEMKVIAFITEHEVVDAILRHLAKTGARHPRGPPSAAALPAAS